MRLSIDVGSELELKLYQAVLLYKNDHGNRHMATVHGVVQQNSVSFRQACVIERTRLILGCFAVTALG
jgi:hypothetical protein